MLGTDISTVQDIVLVSLVVLFINKKMHFKRMSCINFAADGLWNNLYILQDLIR